MFKSWLPVSVRGANFLSKTPALTISAERVKRFKSSRTRTALNPEYSKLSSFPNILTEPDPPQLGGKVKPKVDLTSEPLIKCKRAEFNHYRNQKYKDGKIELASKGWRRTKSKDDYFSILIHTKDYVPETSKVPSTFRETFLHETLIQILHEHGVKEPSEIQSKAIPQVLAGKNCLLAAETGCGKTIAYLAPLIQQILQFKNSPNHEDSDNAPIGLIITPSRDLAEQIHEVASWFASDLDLDCQLLTGGRGKQKMLNADFGNVDLMIASLGILSKFTTTGICSLKNIRHVVLDEADTLLDDGFNELLLHYLRKIQFSSGEYRKDQGAQMILASATMPTSLSSLLCDVVDMEKLEKITTSGLHFIMPHVKQHFHRVIKSDRPAYLLRFAKEAQKKRIPTLIFSNKTVTSDWISIFLSDNGMKCLNLNGDMPSALRIGRFKMFQNGEVNFLSTTDLCARGLDTKRAERVINYEFPHFIADYIHRVGRLGRLGSPQGCEVFNLVTDGDDEIKLVQDLELAVRSMTSFNNVNSNIRRMLQNRIEKSTKAIYEISSDPPPSVTS